MTKQLPPQPNLEQLKKQAKAILKGHQAADPAILRRIRDHHPRGRGADDDAVRKGSFTLSDAQLVLAHEYGFKSLAALKEHTLLHEAGPSSEATVRALRDAAGGGDLARLGAVLDAHPELINEPGGAGVRTALHQAVFGKSGPCEGGADVARRGRGAWDSLSGWPDAR